MTKTPTSTHSESNSEPLDTLLPLLWGFVPARVIQLATERGLFDSFGATGDVTLSLQEICEKLEWKESPTTAALAVLERVGLIRCGDGAYTLCDSAKVYLRKNSTKSITPYLERKQKLEAAYEHLGTVLATGLPNDMMRKETKAAFGVNKSATRDFVRTMHAAAQDFGPTLVNKLTTLLDPKEPNTFLDVGCGHGSLSELLAEKFEYSQVSAFDLSGVTEWARSHIAKQPALKPRVSIHTSDWKTWRWSENAYDLVLLSQVLHEFEKSEAEKLFARASESITVNGLVVVVSVGDISHESGDLLSAIFSLNMLVETGGFNPNVATLREWGDKVSLKEILVERLPGGRSVWIGKKKK
jgi:cyclopropane fatty-acyl-phospholipid synthase-like methyltransferase